MRLFQILQETIEVDTKSIGAEGVPFVDLRRRVLLLLRQWRGAGSVFHNKATGIDIALSAKGISKATSSAGEDLLKIHYALPQILQDSQLLGEEKPKDNTEPSLISVLRFVAEVYLDGRPRKVIAVVKKQSNGQHYYYSLQNMIVEKW